MVIHDIVCYQNERYPSVKENITEHRIEEFLEALVDGVEEFVYNKSPLFTGLDLFNQEFYDMFHFNFSDAEGHFRDSYFELSSDKFIEDLTEEEYEELDDEYVTYYFSIHGVFEGIFMEFLKVENMFFSVYNDVRFNENKELDASYYEFHNEPIVSVW